MRVEFFVFSIMYMFAVTGCGTKTYEKQESVFIVFKTPTFKYADLGFVYANKEEMKVEIYSSGEAVMSLQIGKKQICTSWFECLDKKSFNKKVLSKHYPVDILNHIFRGEEIFSGKNIHKIRNGFTQTIVQAHKYNINYRVLNKQILFHDTISAIDIKIKRLGL